MTRRTLESRMWFNAHKTAIRIVDMPSDDGLLVMVYGSKRIFLKRGMRRKQRLSTLLHELIHLSCALELPAWGELEETVTLAVERDMLRYVYASKGRLRRWLQYMDRITALTREGA